ncbi:DUF3389 family protein [Shewanella dokdonensis]|uniref:DUF3389 family protein n=1 Tax=Shewanella dokdonensis TaxID=712036 RepID=A0ABX8DF10_9GAMM|nr:DUF3389 family protein [Shewanella dokdonensis]MCL1074860.1 DUF3389 domain-containing protein [Shewanella dokdonensis]QVK23327.1 DUF3389 family protein [Shewanella dokdonensis]
MKLNISGGYLLVNPRELQVRLQSSQVVMTVLAEDIRLLASARLLLADAGAVRWQLPLDSDEQLQQLVEFYGITPE